MINLLKYIGWSLPVCTIGVGLKMVAIHKFGLDQSQADQTFSQMIGFITGIIFAKYCIYE